MRDKIKNLFAFIGRAWRGGIGGKAGFCLVLFSLFMFVRIFWGQVNIIKFTRDIWRLSAERTELATEQKKLEMINLHIQLLRNYSSDYIEELGLKKNIGAPEFRVLKI